MEARHHDEDQILSRWLSDAELSELALGARTRFALTSNRDWDYFFSFENDTFKIESSPGRQDADFSIYLDADHWLDLTSASPTPGRQSILAYLGPAGGATLRGDEEAFAQNLQLVRRVIEVARPPREETTTVISPRSGIRGGYVRVNVSGVGVCDVFYEQAGEGIPILLLATAGSDTRQFHDLMSEPRLCARFHMTAMDLPWHGKSNPAQERRNLSYTLDADRYVQTVVAVLDALEVDRPIIFGSSMAGAIVIEIAARRPERVSGVIAAQVGPRVGNRRTNWLRNPRVNQALHVAEWTYGLMSPESPKIFRDRVWWGYSQGGYGVYDADLGYYCDDWDVDNVKNLLSDSVPIVLLSGSYDYSVPPTATRELASQIPWAIFREMPELGHFPHAENPPVFSDYLLWSLDQLHLTDLPSPEKNE